MQVPATACGSPKNSVMSSTVHVFLAHSRRPDGDTRSDVPTTHMACQALALADLVGANPACRVLLDEVRSGSQGGFPLFAVAIRELVDLAESNGEG